jgi:hypothetical protein
MKKLLVTLSFAAFCLAQISSPVAAADVSAGASFWYADWKMQPKGEKTQDYGTELMYGPVLSAKITKELSFAGAFLVSNKYSPDTEFDTHKYRRVDSDLTLNYSLNSYFKIFGGSKFMQFTGDGFYHRSVGPGLGLGFILPLVDNLYLVGNGSYSYMFYGREKDQSTEKLKESGYNLTGGFAYYIASASLSINLGYRYQSFRTKYDIANSIDIDHTFKGFTASVVYSF